jgi:hypothetical protein
VIIVIEPSDEDKAIDEAVSLANRVGADLADRRPAPRLAPANCPCISAGAPRDWCWVAASPYCRHGKPNRSALS